MKVNLKNITRDKEYLKIIQGALREEILPSGKALASKLEKVIRVYEEIETDLELSGESIIELDKPRLEALEERNKFLKFMNNSDDL